MVRKSTSFDGPLFETAAQLDELLSTSCSLSASSRRRRRRNRALGTNSALSASCSSLPSSAASSSFFSSASASSLTSSPSLGPYLPSHAARVALEAGFLEGPLPVPTPSLAPAPRSISRSGLLATSAPTMGAFLTVNLGSAAAATAAAAAASKAVSLASLARLPDTLSRDSSSLSSRPSRAERGRSGRRHRRDTGVSIRALRIVDAARLGPWPPAAFSKLCNCLKDAPPTLIDVTLALRPTRGSQIELRGLPPPRAQAAELLVQHAVLRGGGTTFQLEELCAEDLGGNLVLRAAMSNMSSGVDTSAVRQIARLWV